MVYLSVAFGFDIVVGFRPFPHLTPSWIFANQDEIVEFFDGFTTVFTNHVGISFSALDA